MGKQQQPQQRRRPTRGMTKGAMHRVPCPHCKRPIDFRALATAEGEASGFGAYGIETGTVISCDHCGRKAQIQKVAKVTIIWLRQHNRPVRRPGS